VTTALLMLLLNAAQHRLEWSTDAAAACGTEETFDRAVTERLGYSPFTPGGPLRITVGFRKEKAQRIADLRVYGENGGALGEKSLTSGATDCNELILATALAAALAIDPMLLMRPASAGVAADSDPQLVLPAPKSEGRTPVTHQEPPPPSPPAVVREPVPSPLEAPATSRVVVSVGTGATFNQLPTVMFQASADLAWESPIFSLGARANFTAPSYLAVQPGGLKVSAVNFSGLLCIGAERGACFFLQLGALNSWAVDLPKARTATTVSAAVGLQPYVDFWVADAWRLRVQAGAQAQPATTVLFVGPDEVWRTPVLSFFAFISIGYRAARF
jgi:hypothetical protein